MTQPEIVYSGNGLGILGELQDGRQLPITLTVVDLEHSGLSWFEQLKRWVRAIDLPTSLISHFRLHLLTAEWGFIEGPPLRRYAVGSDKRWISLEFHEYVARVTHHALGVRILDDEGFVIGGRTSDGVTAPNQRRTYTFNKVLEASLEFNNRALKVKTAALGSDAVEWTEATP